MLFKYNPYLHQHTSLVPCCKGCPLCIAKVSAKIAVPALPVIVIELFDSDQSWVFG